MKESERKKEEKVSNDVAFSFFIKIKKNSLVDTRRKCYYFAQFNGEEWILLEQESSSWKIDFNDNVMRWLAFFWASVTNAHIWMCHVIYPLAPIPVICWAMSDYFWRKMWPFKQQNSCSKKRSKIKWDQIDSIQSKFLIDYLINHWIFFSWSMVPRDLLASTIFLFHFITSLFAH